MGIKDGPGTSFCARKYRTVPKNNIGMAQGQRSQLGGAINGQTWNNLTTKIIKNNNS